jgi:hypothetical protein
MTDTIDFSNGPQGQEADDPAQSIRRLTLLNQIANSFILASASQQKFGRGILPFRRWPAPRDPLPLVASIRRGEARAESAEELNVRFLREMPV